MNIRFLKLILLMLTFGSLIMGCRSTKDYAGLAQAGTTYVAAMNSLLVATGNIGIDATSEKLLQDDALSNQSLELYKNLSDEDEKMLKVISQLRQHVNLLGQYFELLHDLANSDAPGRAQQAIGNSDSGLIGNLNKVGNQLRGSGFIPSTVSAATVPITNAVVSGIIRGALKDELQLRKDTIQKELFLQEQLLSALSDKINHDLTITQQSKEQRLVIGPLTSPTPIANPDTWINNRRSVLTIKLTAEQLQTASNNIKKLRHAFDDLMTGKLTFANVNSLLADFNTLLTIAEKLKGQ